jgi:hypothetical protein
MSGCGNADNSTIDIGATYEFKDLRLTVQSISYDSFELEDGSVEEAYSAIAWVRIDGENFSPSNEILLWTGRQIVIGEYRISISKVTQHSVSLRVRIIED